MITGKFLLEFLQPNEPSSRGPVGKVADSGLAIGKHVSSNYYPDWGFSEFPSVSLVKYRNSTLNKALAATFYILSPTLFWPEPKMPKHKWIQFQPNDYRLEP